MPAGGDWYSMKWPRVVSRGRGGSTGRPPRVTTAVGPPLGRRSGGGRRRPHLPPARRSRELGPRSPSPPLPEEGRGGVAADAARSSRGGTERRRRGGEWCGWSDRLHDPAPGCLPSPTALRRRCGRPGGRPPSSLLGGGASQLTAGTHVSLPAGPGSVGGRQKHRHTATQWGHPVVWAFLGSSGDRPSRGRQGMLTATGPRQDRPNTQRSTREYGGPAGV